MQSPQGGFPGQRKFAHIMVGQKSATGRPVLKLKDGSSLPGPFIEFVYERRDPATGNLVFNSNGSASGSFTASCSIIR